MSPRTHLLSCIGLSCLLLTGARAAVPPVITGTSPDPFDAGGQTFLLAINGTGFISGAVARLTGNAIQTQFVSSTQLKAEITTAARAYSGHPSLAVANPDGTLSPPWQIHISPVVGTISPAVAQGGGPAVTVTVTGIGLTPGDALLWSVPGKQTAILATFVDSTKLTAVIPPSLLVGAQSAAVQIVETASGVASATSVAFDVLPVPTIASLSPNPVDAGGDYFVLTVSGTGFVPNSVVNWNGTALGATYLSATQLQAAITPDLRALSGTFPLTVSVPGVTTSTAASFTVSPVLFTLSPASAPVGGSALTVTATGVGFTRTSVLNFIATPLATTFVSSTSLTAVLPATLLKTTFTATLQVIDSAGSGHSLPQLFPILAAPLINGISPTSAAAGSAAFTLTVTAANCPAGCVVQWNGSPLATLHASDTIVTASVPANLIETAGIAKIQLVNPSGGASNSSAFTVNPPPASLVSLSPASVSAGSAAFTLTVNGSAFVAGSTVLWNGSALPTTWSSSTVVTALVSADLVSVRAGISASVTVVNPGGATSNNLTLTIDPPRPTLVSLTPATAPTGGAGLTVLLGGTNFAANCVVRWNDSAVDTTFIDSGHLRASVPSSLLATAGAMPVTVTNPSGMAASPMTFTLIASTPAASGVAPASVTEGAAAFTVTVYGAFFTADSTVQWNSAPLVTSLVSKVQVSALVPADLVSAAGGASITVANPGGLVSNPVAFAITAHPPPVITAGGVVNAFSSLPAIAPGALISIYGTNLASAEGHATFLPLPNSLNGTSVLINGVPVPLLFVSTAQINAQAPFEAATGTATVVVQNSAFKSQPARVNVAAAAPGILTLPGASHALAVNYPSGALNAAQNPVHPGEYVVLYLTGQGSVNRSLASGAESPADPLAIPVSAVQAKLGGQPAVVSFAGMAPGFVGLLQLNLLIPTVMPGDQILQVSIGGVAANPATLSVAANH